MATSTTMPTSNPSAGEISGGAVAEIVIGAVVGLAGIAIAAFWCVKKRRTSAEDATLPQELDCAPNQDRSPFIKSEPHTPQPLELLTTEEIREMPVREVLSPGDSVELQGQRHT